MKPGDVYAAYNVTVKDTESFTLKMDGNPQQVGLMVKWSGKPAIPPAYKLWDSIQMTLTHSAANHLLGFGLSTSREALGRRLVAKYSMQISGDQAHEKRKRQMSWKGELKNFKLVGGALSTTFDWAVPAKRLLTLESSFCVHHFRPFFMGVSSTSKMDATRWVPMTSSFSAFINYKAASFTSAASL